MKDDPFADDSYDFGEEEQPKKEKNPSTVQKKTNTNRTSVKKTQKSIGLTEDDWNYLQEIKDKISPSLGFGFSVEKLITHCRENKVRVV